MICLDNGIIWRGPASEVPEKLNIRVSSAGAGCLTVFSTGDTVTMRSSEKLTKEQQEPINKIILKMWEKLSEEERRNLLMEELFLTEI